jgi:hypothetical protein
MSLPSYIEKILSLTGPNSDEPGAIAQQTATQYLYPIVPPNTTAYFVTALPITSTIAAARGFTNLFAVINYRMRTGNMPPGVFQLTLIESSGTAFSGTVPGEIEIDFLNFLTPNKSVIAYITNITDANQRFEMWNEYLIIPTVKHWKWLKESLLKINFPYKLPDYSE